LAERYARARARVPWGFRPLLEALAQRISSHARNGWHLPETVDGMIEGRPVRVLIGATQGNLHVSVSRSDVQRGKIGRSLPSWEDLVSVRACCWPDDVEVVQVLPALAGDDEEEWINVAEVLHLRGPLLGPLGA
jgi:hypothetical protein